MSARRFVTLLAVALVAATLAGCGEGGVNAPPGPAQPASRTAPPSNTATGESAHAGAKAVTPEVRTSVAAAMAAAGMSVVDTSALTMTYSTDRQQVTVTGSGVRMSATATQTAPRTVLSVTLEQAGGKWRVLNVVSEK